MLVAGIDLAAEPKATALAILQFKNSKARLVYLEQGLDDQALIDKTITADKVGIDCAFGWPIEFAKFIAKHQDPTNKDLIDGGMDFRRRNPCVHQLTAQLVTRSLGLVVGSISKRL